MHAILEFLQQDDSNGMTRRRREKEEEEEEGEGEGEKEEEEERKRDEVGAELAIDSLQKASL
ncbi:hypothetical protein V1478_016030 [Vespula squamosa]|uniref:Uncharacterized protein n=1 Tax=Vespula squamosa TaxID=30214 RepID=A0ABD2A558_VESSQ